MNNSNKIGALPMLRKRLSALLIVQLVATVLTICTVILSVAGPHLIFVPGSNLILAITSGGAILSRSVFAAVAVATVTILMFLTIFELRRGGWRSIVPAAFIAAADVIFGMASAFLVGDLFYYDEITVILLVLCGVFSIFLFITEVQYIIHAKKAPDEETESPLFKPQQPVLEQDAEQIKPSTSNNNELLYRTLAAESVLTAVAVIPAIYKIDIFISNLTVVRCVEFLKECLVITEYSKAIPIFISLILVIAAFYLAVMPLSAKSVKKNKKTLPLLSLIFHFAELCAILISFSFYLSIYGTVWFGLLPHTLIDVFIIVLIMKYL